MVAVHHEHHARRPAEWPRSGAQFLGGRSFTARRREQSERCVVYQIFGGANHLVFIGLAGVAICVVDYQR